MPPLSSKGPQNQKKHLKCDRIGVVQGQFLVKGNLKTLASLTKYSKTLKVI